MVAYANDKTAATGVGWLRGGRKLLAALGETRSAVAHLRLFVAQLVTLVVIELVRDESGK
jgi:hypothetical protein